MPKPNDSMEPSFISLLLLLFTTTTTTTTTTFCFLVFTSQFILSNAQDTLHQGQSIKDGHNQTHLVSAGKVFELGFFSPGGKSTLRYAAIWYRNINSTQSSVLWIANRDAPLTYSSSSSGSLTLRPDGNMAVLDGSGNVVWSTNSSNSTNSNSTAQLMDSGNLVVQETDRKSVLWQSFDHPTDTFIPGMKMTLNRKTGQNTLLTSWKSPDDPSPGNYTVGLNPKGSLQFFIWDGAKPRCRSGQWNGDSFIGSPIRPVYTYGFELTDEDSQGVLYFTYKPYNTSLLRFVLQWDGVENTSMLVGGSGRNTNNLQWKSVWLQPLNECDIYGKCGEYGICAYNNGAASCRCLTGFEPESKGEWSRGNWSRGCARKAPLQCQLKNINASRGGAETDGFLPVEGVKLPDLSDWVSILWTEAGCRSICLNNCSCEAYAFGHGIGCLIWGPNLIDTYEFSTTEGGYVLNLKLAASELAASELGTAGKKTWKIIVTIICTIMVATITVCLFFWWNYNARIRNWWKGGQKGFLSRALCFSQEVKADLLQTSEGGEGKELQFYRFDQLATATSKFSDSNKLGKGGFGDVYKGILPGGGEIAVKRLSASSGQGHDEFKNEVILIAKLQHRNLVRLMGCCIQEEEKILVYEYMPNRSLDAFLFETTKQAILDWNQRFNIIEGIARGVLYLHRDSRLRIVHRDLKASNVLLDEHMNPKISDFGMARIFGGDQNQANTNRVVGTYGYMSPEYAMEGIFSVKSDVYSFGVLVLEIVTGRKNNIFRHKESSLNIIGYAWRFWSEDRAMELIDQSILNTCSTDQVIRCIHIALLCVQDHATDRPDMASVVHMLGSETAIFPLPKQPKFALVRNPSKMEMAVVNEIESTSGSDLTITVLEGR